MCLSSLLGPKQEFWLFGSRLGYELGHDWWHLGAWERVVDGFGWSWVMVVFNFHNGMVGLRIDHWCGGGWVYGIVGIFVVGGSG